MAYLIPPLFRRDTPSVTKKRLMIRRGETIAVEDIEDVEVQSAWTVFVGVTSDVTLSLRNKRKTTIHNLRDAQVKRLLDDLKTINANIRIIERPPFVGGKRLLLPDVILPSWLLYGVLLLAVSLALLGLLALRAF